MTGVRVKKIALRKLMVLGVFELLTLRKLNVF